MSSFSAVSSPIPSFPDEVDWSSLPRPLSEFFSRFTIPRPSSKWNFRLKCNLYYYRTNYLLLIVMILGLAFQRRPLAIVATILTALSIAFLNDSFAGTFSEKVTRSVRQLSPHLAAKMRPLCQKKTKDIKMEAFHYFFLFLITARCVSTIIPAVESKCIPEQQRLLLDFKNSLVFNASRSSKLIFWNSTTDCCSWRGITCSATGRVLGLDISSEYISGGIHNSCSLFHLPNLQRLSLADNQLGKGSQLIPSAIGQLTSLMYLDLSLNDYSGQIPIEISHLTGLKVLDISNHYSFVEKYPIGARLKLESPTLHMLVQNLTELRVLKLDYVQISAPGSAWCQAISSSLPNLKVLSLSSCNLSGPFHHSLANLQSLSVIELDFNNISAPVPGFFANFSNLTSLSCFECGLQGTFPKEVFQLPSLQDIQLGNNLVLHGSLPQFSENGSLQMLGIEGTSFSGSLPDSIGNLKLLSSINVDVCYFTGSIPKSMENLTQLVSLSMHGNKFEGSIPSFNRAKNLGFVDLSSNVLTGNIDGTHWGNLTYLIFLSLEDNMLTGNIPSSLFSLPFMGMLILSRNKFFGQFPEISNISSNSLELINLSFNNLEGPLPMSIFDLRGLSQLGLSSNNFSGSFSLADLQHLRNLGTLDLSHNSLFLSHEATNFSNSYFPQFQSKLELLDLSNNHISMMPNFSGSVGDVLLNTKFFSLSSNNLEGIIPESICNLQYLEVLDLSNNSLSGTVPHCMTRMSSLQGLNLRRSNLKFFSMSSNNLEGIIPESICNLQYLEVLDLSNNSFSGTVPHCLSTMSSLQVLNLRRNNLTDVGELSQNCSLQTLDMSENHIRGQFLKSLVNCPHLEILNLGNNQIRGPFPCFLKNTSALRVLVLRANKFYGGIGCLKTNGIWPMLQIIDLAHNDLSGEVPGRVLTTWQAMIANEDDAKLTHCDNRDNPAGCYHYIHYGNQTGGIYYLDKITSKGLEMELVRILTIFTSIDFSCNKFSGSIPEEIGELKSLHILNLSNNAFTGAIPSSFSDSSQLESLDLSKNNLSGQIPPQLAKLNFLEALDLSNNQLVGRIPTSNQFSTFPKSSFEGNKDLFGYPLTEDDRTTGLSSPALKKSHPNSGDEVDWDLISVEMGFTFGFGIAIGSLLLCYRWRKWYYRTMFYMLLKIFPQLEERFGNHRRHVSISQLEERLGNHRRHVSISQRCWRRRR